MTIRQYVDGNEYRAWLIGCGGPGVETDVVALRRVLETELGAGYRASVTRPRSGAGTVTQRQIKNAFAAMWAFRGHRLVWFGGHADLRDGQAFFRTDGRRADHTPVESLYDQLDALAKAGDTPLVAIMDFCHAASTRARLWDEKLVLFCAAHSDESARGTDEDGGVFTQAVLRALREATANEAGQITVDAVRTRVNAQISSGTQHPFFAVGMHGTRPLNAVSANSTVEKMKDTSGAILDQEALNQIIDALDAADLLGAETRPLLLAGIPRRYTQRLTVIPAPLTQAQRDLQALNRTPTLTGLGEPPLAVYLAAAALQADPRPERSVFEALRAKVLAGQGSSAPRAPAPPPMSPQALRRALAKCYPTVADARTLCEDAQLALDRINFAATGIRNVWHSALSEARLTNKINTLRALARESYPDQF